MRKSFSAHWIASSKPRKQRKYLANAPLHTRHNFLSAPLSKPLREKHGKRSVPIRKGDEVLVMRGSFKKKKAKIASVDTKRSRVTIEGIQRAKKDGAKVNVYFNPSNLQIQALNLDDKLRLSANKNSSSTKEKKNAPNKS